MATSLAALSPQISLQPVFGHVERRAERVIIVGGGPSLREMDLNRLSHATAGRAQIIAINRAIEWLPRADIFFTLDPSASNIRLMMSRRVGVRYYAAVPPSFGTPAARLERHRGLAPADVTYLQRIEGDGPMKSRGKLSEDIMAIHTGNSAWGALGVAYHMRPQRIILLGVDARQDGYAFGSGQPGPLEHVPDLFKSALPQLSASGVKVVNGSRQSRVDCFERTTPAAAADWITEDII